MPYFTVRVLSSLNLSSFKLLYFVAIAFNGYLYHATNCSLLHLLHTKHFIYSWLRNESGDKETECMRDAAHQKGDLAGEVNFELFLFDVL